MRQRVKLAQAIVHDPDLVFLDEPTAGMDPQGREEMLELVERIYRKLGIAVVFSSHILEDIERVCDYVVILDGGKLVTAQPLGDLGRIGGEIIVRIDGDADAFARALRRQGVGGRGRDVELGQRRDGRRRRRRAGLRPGPRSRRRTRWLAALAALPRRGSLEDIYLGDVEAAREASRWQPMSAGSRCPPAERYGEVFDRGYAHYDGPRLGRRQAVALAGRLLDEAGDGHPQELDGEDHARSSSTSRRSCR